MEQIQNMTKNSGQITRFDTLFSWRLFAISKNTKTGKESKKYTWLLKVFVIDPVTGMHMLSEDKINAVLKKQSESLSMDSENDEYNNEQNVSIKNKHNYEIFASKYFDTKDITESELKSAISELCSRLYSKNESTLLRKKNEIPAVGNLNSNQIYLRYHKEFFKSLTRCSESTLKRKRTVLKQACEFLMGTPIKKIKKEKIKKLFEERKFRQYKSLICAFFSYARDKNAYTGVNPIEEYLKYNYLLKKQKGKDFYSRSLEYIPIENEMRLHELILKHLKEKEIMAVIMPKCLGISLNEAIELRWESFMIKDEVVYYIDVKNKDTLSSRDWTHPALGEGAFFLRLLMHDMEEEYGDKANWDNKKIIPIREQTIDGNGKKRVTKIARLTRYVREMLKESGLTDIEISSASPGDKNAGGAGVALLKKHYRYVLTERCGLSEDSPEFKFLNHLNPLSVTDKYYRSMSDSVSGLPFYETIARRDNFFISDKSDNDKECVETVSNEGVIYEIPSQGPRNKTSVSIKNVFIPKGTIIMLGSGYGHSGTVSFVSENGVGLGRAKDIY